MRIPWGFRHSLTHLSRVQALTQIGEAQSPQHFPSPIHDVQSRRSDADAPHSWLSGAKQTLSSPKPQNKRKSSLVTDAGLSTYLRRKCDSWQRWLVQVISPYDLRTLLILSSFFTILSAANPSTSFIRPPHPPKLSHRKQQQQHIHVPTPNFSAHRHTDRTEKATRARLVASESNGKQFRVPTQSLRLNCHSKLLSQTPPVCACTDSTWNLQRHRSCWCNVCTASREENKNRRLS